MGDNRGGPRPLRREVAAQGLRQALKRQRVGEQRLVVAGQVKADEPGGPVGSLQPGQGGEQCFAVLRRRILIADRDQSADLRALSRGVAFDQTPVGRDRQHGQAGFGGGFARRPGGHGAPCDPLAAGDHGRQGP